MICTGWECDRAQPYRILECTRRVDFQWVGQWVPTVTVDRGHSIGKLFPLIVMVGKDGTKRHRAVASLTGIEYADYRDI